MANVRVSSNSAQSGKGGEHLGNLNATMEVGVLDNRVQTNAPISEVQNGNNV